MEHVDDGEAHYVDGCPGTEECACQRGLERVLAWLTDGTYTVRRVT